MTHYTPKEVSNNGRHTIKDIPANLLLSITHIHIHWTDTYKILTGRHIRLGLMLKYNKEPWQDTEIKNQRPRVHCLTRICFVDNSDRKMFVWLQEIPPQDTPNSAAKITQLQVNTNPESRPRNGGEHGGQPCMEYTPIIRVTINLLKWVHRQNAKLTVISTAFFF